MVNEKAKNGRVRVMSHQKNNTPKKTILVVEDSKVFARILKTSIEANTEFKVVIAETYTETIDLIESRQYEFFASLLDLNLPDAPDGEVVDYALKHDIPAIVFTGKFDDDLRDRILAKGIVDYVLKEAPANIEYIISLLKQLNRNTHIKVLVVDDSRTARTHIKRLLTIYRFIVLEAENGNQALDIIHANKDIMLVITDFNMPQMDGFELTKKLRNLYSKQDMVIIGMSTYGNNLLSARFLKIGGSDFINKPFLEEEFFCRISQNLDLLEYIKELRYIATRDFLTGLYNRRHFFEIGEKLFSRACKSKKQSAVALLDIDFFKRVNDTYGHDVGDVVLRRIGELLNLNFRTGDLVARFGGEEFGFLLPNLDVEDASTIFEGLRCKIEQNHIVLPNNITLSVTASIGVCTTLEENLETALSKADKMLYQAKHAGRNQVIIG
jgi:diguanylate cyclase (GGDEF)-like protein